MYKNITPQILNPTEKDPGLKHAFELQEIQPDTLFLTTVSYKYKNKNTKHFLTQNNTTIQIHAQWSLFYPRSKQVDIEHLWKPRQIIEKQAILLKISSSQGAE